MLTFAIAAIALSAADIHSAIGVDPAMCVLTRIDADGRRTEQPPTKPFRPSAGLTIAARSSGGGAVAVSSSSVTGGETGSKSGRVVRDGLSIAFDQDNQGCRVIVDERPPKE